MVCRDIMKMFPCVLELWKQFPLGQAGDIWIAEVFVLYLAKLIPGH